MVPLFSSACVSKRSKVFIAEDSFNMQLALRDLVESLGGEVVSIASNEAVALDWIKTHPGAWDFAIVDLILDQGAGFSVIRRLRMHSQAGRIIVFSAFLTSTITDHCKQLGADVVFDKKEVGILSEYIEAHFQA